MSKKNIYEVFDAFKECKTKADRIAVLRNNNTYALRMVLYGTFNPSVEFSVKDIPEFHREEIPPGMSYSTMTEALQKIYLFQHNHPKRPAKLTEKREIELLIQILESLEEKEADVYIGMLKKDLKVPYLTKALINEAFPNFLPTEKQT